MITVRQNPNFTKWFQVFSFGKLIDEVGSRTKALRLAKAEARRQEVDRVNYLGEMVKTKN